VRHLTRCPFGVCARPSRNKFAPDSVHAPYPLRRIQTGRDDYHNRENCLLGLVRIHSTRDSCRTQVARSYCYGWGERIPRTDIAGIEKLPDPSTIIEPGDLLWMTSSAPSTLIGQKALNQALFVIG